MKPPVEANCEINLVWKVKKCVYGLSDGGVTSLVARYSLKFTRCLLLVVKSLVTHFKIPSLLLAEVARCKKSLVTRCKICSLLVAEVARCKDSFVTRCKICSLLDAEVESLFVTL